MNPLPLHRRHHSASSNHVLRSIPHPGNAEFVSFNQSQAASSASNQRRRPGSESDVLDVKAAEVSLHHQDSLMLAYHQRASVVAGHNASAVASTAPIRQVKPVYVWNQSEVAKWLKKHLPTSQSIYADLFMQHDITGKTLLMLNDSKLSRMGISEGAHRASIMNEILKLQMKNYMQCFKGLQTAGFFEIQ